MGKQRPTTRPPPTSAKTIGLDLSDRAICLATKAVTYSGELITQAHPLVLLSMLLLR